MHNPMGWGGQYCPGGECLSSMCKALELTLSTIRKQTELLPRTCVRQASIWTYYTYIHKATHLEMVGKNCMHPYVHSFLFLDFHNDPQHHSILNRKQKWVSSSRWMNCGMLKISQLKYLIMNWEKKKRKLSSSKQLYEQIKKKRGVGGKMRWRTKSGLDGTFIKLMACQQDTDEYFCRIKMATWV